MFRGILGSQVVGAGVTLLTATIENTGFSCDPSLGLGRLTWTKNGNYPGSYIELAYDFGLGYVDYNINIDPELLIFLFDIAGEPGFVSLDSTNFRIRWTFVGVDLTGSPLYQSPTYPCA